MFDVEICEPKKVVLVRFRGQLTENDFGALDQLATRTDGSAGYDCIFDMTGVDEVDLATEFVARRGDLPQVFIDRERLYVVPQDDLKLLVRLYAAYQQSRGWRPPAVVATLAEALDRLGVAAVDFRPLPA